MRYFSVAVLVLYVSCGCNSFRRSLHSHVVVDVVSASSTSLPPTQSMKEMSNQMRDMRQRVNAEIAKDERASLMMDALRGKGIYS